MSTLAKVFVVIVLVFAAVLASASATLFTLREDHKAQLREEKEGRAAEVQTLKGQLDTANQELVKARDTIGGLETEKGNLVNAVNLAEQNLAAKEKDLADRSNQITKLQEQSQAFAQALQQTEKSLEDKNAEVVRLLGRVRQMDDQLTKVQMDMKARENQLETATTANAELRDRIARLEQVITQLQEGARQPVVASGTVPPVTARLMKVDPAPQEFVVVQLGRDDKVVKGTQLMVYRDTPQGPQYVGMVSLVTVDKDYSVAKIDQDLRARDPQNRVVPFQVNDRATTVIPEGPAGGEGN